MLKCKYINCSNYDKSVIVVMVATAVITISKNMRKSDFMNLILYTYFCRRVGRELAKKLGIEGRFNPSPRTLKSANKIIRWGYYEPVLSNVPQVNTRESILLASRKFSSLQKLKVANVNVPDFWLQSSPKQDFPDDTIIIGRAFTHTCGEDITVSRTQSGQYMQYFDHIDEFDIPKHETNYYTKYIKPAREWRVHVFGKEIIFAQKKFFDKDAFLETNKLSSLDEDSPEYKEAMIIRNYSHGWRFHTLKDISNLPKACQDMSIRAVDALGLTFGAVDVISHGRDENELRKASVLEVNTAPGLDEINLHFYLEKFKLWLQ